MTNVILADGLVSGTISGGDTTASVLADVSCVNSVPTGQISGTVETFTGQGTTKFTFSSNHPLIVATLKISTLQSVGALFTDVTLKNNTTGTKTKNCIAELTATRLGTNSWVGSLAIVCPNGKILFVFGVFTGNVTVNRQVLCKPLL